MTNIKGKITLLICLALSLLMLFALSSCNNTETPSNDSTNTDTSTDTSTDQGGNENDGGNHDTEYVTVTFDTQGGSKIESVQVEKGGKIKKPQDPERLGYTLEGWYIDGEKWSFAGYVATEDITLTASWTPTIYTIEYIGELNHKNETSYTIEDELELSDGNKSHYDFLGWYEDESYTKPISKIEKGTTGNLTIYGKTSYQPLVFSEVKGGYSVIACDWIATSAVIPDTYNGKPVTSIGSYAFEYCRSLTSITIPDSVTSIGDRAFEDCSSLASITIPFVGATKDGTSNTHFGYIFGASSNSDNDDYVPSSLKEVIITGGSSIGSSAFYKCTSLTSVTIGDSVKSIGHWAFEDCSSLTSVTIPDSVTSIGERAFAYCYSLSSINVNSNNVNYKSIDGVLYNKDATTLICYPAGKASTSFTIPDSVTSIGNYAFYNCTSLTSIKIPDSVTSIDYCAFQNCTSLKYNEYDNGYYLGNKENPYVVFVTAKNTSITSCEINKNTKVIYYQAFYNCESLTSVTIGDSVKSIGHWAFYKCTSLTSVTIGDSVKSIGHWAFEDCSSLTSVTIPDSVTSIGERAFLGCTSLTSIKIPDSVTSIGDWAFAYCYSLTSINVNSNNANYKSIDGVLYNKDATTLICYPAGKASTSFTIPDSVTSIGNYAFA